MEPKNQYQIHEQENIAATKLDIIFRYYEDQWAHIRHHEAQRASLTLQLLLLVAAMGAAFFQTTISIFRITIAAIIFLLGILGLLIFLKTNAAVNIHTQRARHARKSLGFLEEFVTKTKEKRFPKLHLYYSAFYFIIAVVGIMLFLISLI